MPGAFRGERREPRDGDRLWTGRPAVDGLRSGGQLAALDPPLLVGFAEEEDESFDDDDDEDDSFDDDDDDEDSFDAAAGALSFAAPEPFDEPSEAVAALRLSVR
jgi:hypothetical protein